MAITYDDIIFWLSLDFFQPLPFDFLPCCLPAGSVSHGGAPQLCPAPHSAPVWAGTVSGWWCSNGSSGLGDEAATPWSSPLGSSQFYGERDGSCMCEVQPDTSTWHGVNLPVLKLCSSCFVCLTIYQLLRLMENWDKTWKRERKETQMNTLSTQRKVSAHLYTRQPRVREGSGEKGLPQVGFGDVKAHPHRWCVFLNVEPHLNENLGKVIWNSNSTMYAGHLMSCSSHCQHWPGNQQSAAGRSCHTARNADHCWGSRWRSSSAHKLRRTQWVPEREREKVDQTWSWCFQALLLLWQITHLKSLSEVYKRLLHTPLVLQCQL